MWTFPSGASPNSNVLYLAVFPRQSFPGGTDILEGDAGLVGLFVDDGVPTEQHLCRRMLDFVELSMPAHLTAPASHSVRIFLRAVQCTEGGYHLFAVDNLRFRHQRL